MYTYNATCIKVVDGDTIDAEIDLGFDIKVTKRIRLGGINAPESRTRNKVEKKLGLAAKERLKEMMEGAANCFELESQEIGKFGRVIGRLLIDRIAGKDVITKVCVNDCLVKEGHAVEYDGGKRKIFSMNIFKDNNDWNEKSIIGFVAFLIMCVIMIADLATGWYGYDLVINEFVYDSFVWVVLGCFGISGVEKFAKKMKYLGKHKVFDDLMIGGVLLTPPDPATYAYELTLPNDDGTSNQVLTTDGNGVLTWTTVSGGGTTSNALTMGTGFDLSSGAGSWNGSVAETISIDWTEFGNINIGATDNSDFYIRKSTNSSAAAGGDLELRGGSSGSGTNLAAGDLVLYSGLGTGSGTAGLVKFKAGMNTTSGTNGHSGVTNSYMGSSTTANKFTIVEPGVTNTDYLEFKVEANGATTITTVDAAAAAANLDFVVDGQFSIASTGIDISGAGVISNAEWQGTDVGIAYGGTGQSTAQAAIDALTAVSGASTNEVLIKDGSGNATWAAQTDTTYSAATSSTLGLLKIADDTEQTVAAESVSTTASRTYGIQFNSSDQAVVNVPWTDNNTTYSAGNGLDLSGTTFSIDAKANSGIVIDSTELSINLGASNITGVLADGDVAQDLTIVAGSINNTPIGASTANTIAGTTIDASTDFTVGSTVITDDQIQFTPSAGDTATITAGNNGAFDITTSDAAGTKLAHVTITANGTAEIAAAGDITLDSALDIELEPGATDKYVNNVGIFRGGNIGPISDTFIPVMPIEFAVASSYRNYGNILLNGRSMVPSSDRVLHYAQKIIPKGYTASACIVNGVDANSNARVICYVGDISGTAASAVTSPTNLNATATFSSNIVGDGEKYCTIEFDPGETADYIYGAKITIAKT